MNFMRIKRYIIGFLTWVIFLGTIFSQSISTLDDDGTEVSSLVGYPCGDLRTIRISDPSTWTTTFSSQPYCLWQRSDNQGLSWQNLRDSGEGVFEIKVSNDDGTKQLYRVIIANDKTIAEEISMIGIPTNTVIPYAITNEVTLECSLSFCGSQEDRLVVWKEDFNSVPRGERRTCENLVDKKFAGYYNESSSTNVGDGKYAVVSHVEDGSIPSYNWFSGGTDHTGNKDGGFLIINNKDDQASANKLMFEKKVEFDLCPDTWYYFSIYAMCITGGAADNPNRTYAPCNFRFEIIGEDGVTVLVDDESGDVPVTPRGISTWYNYGVSFNSGNNKNVLLRIYDNAIKGVYGNDMAIDDISLIACHKRIPNVQLSAKMDVDEEGVCGEKTRLRLSDLSEWKLYYDKIYCLWQSSIDGGLTWDNVTGGFDTTYIDVTFKKMPEGVRYRVIFASNETEANQIAEKGYLDDACHPYAISNVSTLTCHCEPLPISLTPQDTLICKSATITLTPKVEKEIDEELEYEWYYKEEGATEWTVVAQENGTTTDTIYSKTYDITPLVQTQYFAISKSASCGGDHTDTITVSLIDSIRFDLTLSKDIICEGESVTLSVENIQPITSDFVWSSLRESDSGFSPISQATGTTYQESPSESTTYVVSAKMAECASQSDTVRLVVTKTADFDLKISKEIICLGESIQIDVENGTAASSDYTWSVQRGNATTFSPITSSSGLSYQDSPTEDVTYVVSVAGGAICPDKTDTVRVKVVESDQLDLTISKETICKGESVTLAIENGTATEYEWTARVASATTYSQISNITGTSYQDSPTESLEYVVSTKAGHCPAVTDTARVEVVSPDQFDLSISKETICKGESMTIAIENGTATEYEWAAKGSSATTYSQISNVAGASYQDSPTESMEYVVSTKAGHCPAVTDTVRVEVVEPDQFDLTISKEIICKGESVTIAIENGTATEYEWTGKEANATTYSQITNATGTTYQDSPTESMEYVVSTKAGHCPVVTDTVRVKVEQPLVISATSDQTIVCVNSQVHFSVEASDYNKVTFVRYPENDNTSVSVVKNFTGTEQGEVQVDDEVTENTYYELRQTEGNSCPDASPVVIRIMTEDSLKYDAVTQVLDICQGDPVELSAKKISGEAKNFSWKKTTDGVQYDNVSSEEVTTVYPMESCEYWLTAESEHCGTIAQQIEKINLKSNNKKVSLTTSATNVCEQEQVTLTTQYEDGSSLDDVTEIVWYRSTDSLEEGEVISQAGEKNTEKQIQADETAYYRVQYISQGECSAQYSEKVKVEVEKKVQVSLQANSMACMGMEFPIQVKVEGTPQRIDFYEQLSNGSKKKYDVGDGEVKVVLIEKSLLYTVEAFGHYCPSSSNYLQVFPDKDTPLEWTTPDDTAFCEYQYIHFDAQYEHIEQLVWEYAEEESDSFTVIDKGVDRIDTLWTSEKATSMTLRLTAQTPKGCFRKEKIQKLYMDAYYHPASWNYDTIICKGDEVTLCVNPNDSNYRYEWHEYDLENMVDRIVTVGPTFTIRPTKHVSYGVEAIGKRCVTASGYDVSLDEPMKIETEIIDNRSIALQVSGGYGSYQYDLGQGFGTSNVIEDFDYIRYYQVKVRDEIGCEVDTVIKVHEVELKFPEFFTPQSDGVNDVWLVENLNYYKGVTVRIYDRIGKLLFETKNPDEGWNGEYLGHAMPSTDYWYEVYVKDIKEVYSGHFTLIRK